MTSLDIVADLIREFNPEKPHFHATEIYNESWLLKAILHQTSKLGPSEFPLAFAPKATWFSEAYLPTAFKARYHGDPLAEARTHADGTIGHFTIGRNAKSDLQLESGTRQFTVVEAKMKSPLSSGSTNAPGYDQAARTVACMAEALLQTSLQAVNLEKLSYVVLAPAEAIEAGTFSSQMTSRSIREKVHIRVAAYEGGLDGWYEGWFLPLIDIIDIYTLSWEAVLDWVWESDQAAARALQAFYERCLEFN